MFLQVSVCLSMGGTLASGPWFLPQIWYQVVSEGVPRHWYPYPFPVSGPRSFPGGTQVSDSRSLLEVPIVLAGVNYSDLIRVPSQLGLGYPLARDGVLPPPHTQQEHVTPRVVPLLKTVCMVGNFY